MRILFAIIFGVSALLFYQVDHSAIDYSSFKAFTETATTASINSAKLLSRNLGRRLPPALRSNIGSLYNRPVTASNSAFFSTSSSKMAVTDSAKPSSTFAGLPAVPPSDPSLTKPANESVPRKIAQAFLAIEQSEGAGARVRRSIGTPKLRRFSPFLMLDHFSIGPGAGFPDHPHRGQETITYLLEGGVDHEDFAGHKGTIGPGDLQFMTAGRGIVHAEMPTEQPDGSQNVGLQLWVDLPKHLKACEPRYRDLRATEIPKVEVDDGKVTVKVISGESHGVQSVQELAYTPVWLLDIEVRPGGSITQPVPAGWNTFVYLLAGEADFDTGSESKHIKQYHNVVFEQKGDNIKASVAPDAKETARMVLVAGTPLDQPVVQYGPFVLSSQEEVRQALMDYSTYQNGFERANGWESEIGKRMG